VFLSSNYVKSVLPHPRWWGKQGRETQQEHRQRVAETIKIVFLNIRGCLIFFLHVLYVSASSLLKDRDTNAQGGTEKGDQESGEAPFTREGKPDLSCKIWGIHGSEDSLIPKYLQQTVIWCHNAGEYCIRLITSSGSFRIDTQRNLQTSY